MKKPISSTKTESSKKGESELFFQLRFLLKKEILFGLLFVILGVTLLFRKLLDVQLDVLGIFSAFFFMLGVWFHLKSFQDKDFIKLFLPGQMFLLLSLTFSEHLIPLGLGNIFILFVLFLLMAVSALVFTLHPDYPILIVLSALTLLLIVAYLLSSEAPLRIHGTAGLWFIAYICYYISIVKPLRSRLFLIMSGLFFLFGFMNISSHSESFVPVILLWFLGAGSFVFYTRNKKNWFLLILTFVFLMSGFAAFNDSLIKIFPNQWMALFWMLGFAASFLAVWYLSKQREKMKWSFWVGICFAIAGSIIFITDIARLEGEIIGPSILIIVGIWLIYTKAIKQGRSTRKS